MSRTTTAADAAPQNKTISLSHGFCNSSDVFERVNQTPELQVCSLLYVGRFIAKLEECNVKVEEYNIIPDEKTEIQKKVNTYVSEDLDLIIFTGGIICSLLITRITSSSTEPVVAEA